MGFQDLCSPIGQTTFQSKLLSISVTLASDSNTLSLFPPLENMNNNTKLHGLSSLNSTWHIVCTQYMLAIIITIIITSVIVISKYNRNLLYFQINFPKFRGKLIIQILMIWKKTSQKYSSDILFLFLNTHTYTLNYILANYAKCIINI